MSFEHMILRKENFIANAKIIIDKKIPLVSNLANLSRLIIASFPQTSWAGFYLYNNEKKELYLGPFQGEMACTIIPCGKGVCGNAIKLKETQLVPNVHTYFGHIACSSLTNSEVVVPIFNDNIPLGVIDLDSTEFNNYDLTDVKILEELANLLKEIME